MQLVMAPEEKTFYINFHNGFQLIGIHDSKKEADRWAGNDRIGCVKVTCVKGHYDD